MKKMFFHKSVVRELVGCVNKIREHELLINRSKLIIQSRNEPFLLAKTYFSTFPQRGVLQYSLNALPDERLPLVSSKSGQITAFAQHAFPVYSKALHSETSKCYSKANGVWWNWKMFYKIFLIGYIFPRIIQIYKIRNQRENTQP